MSQMSENIIDVHFQQNFSLQKIVKNFPPTDRNLFYKWLNTSISEDWQYKWSYLKTLNTDDYLRMYAQLPVLVVDESPKVGSAKYELFCVFQERYLAKSIWLKQLIDYGIPNYQEIYDCEALNLYRQEVNISMGELDLCRAIVRHSKYSFNSLFKTPIYLWFWIQVANCIKYFKNNGIEAALPIERIRIKSEVYHNWGKLIKYYEDEVNKNNITTITCKSLPEFLLNLPAILVPMGRNLINEQYDSMLESAIENYINAEKSSRIFMDVHPDVQVATVYKHIQKSKRGRETISEKLFISGVKTKRPKY
jgi:hypothetical protein